MRRLLLIAVLVMTLGACSNGAKGEELRGVVVGIESRGLGDVQSFTLKNLDNTYEIYVDPEITYGFPVSHLATHRAAAEPLVVGTETRNGRLYALSIEDG